jgi:hypothetical protein
MEPLHANLAPMIAAWMGGALLSLATAGLKHRLGLRPRPAAARRRSIDVPGGRRTAAPVQR